MKNHPSEEIQRLLREVVDHFDKEDVAIRERQIRTWRRLKLFWEGFQKAWYSEVAHDWRIWDDALTGDDTEQSAYDKPINVFRAYLESIIAALSITIPPIKCYPDDADNTLDLSTAKAGDKIAELVFRHNNVNILWLHALFIFCTEGMVACYTYPKSDEKYGTYDKKTYGEFEENHQYADCPNCNHRIDDLIVPPGTTLPPMETGPSEMGPNPMTPEQVPNPMTGAPPNPVSGVGNPSVNDPMQGEELINQARDEFMPDDSDVPIQDAISYGDLCPACMQLITPIVSQETLYVTKLVGVTKEPKTRMCMEAYGGLYIKVPNYAKKQEDCPYLLYSYETHYANAVDKYADLRKEDTLRKKIVGSTGPKDPYEQWGRLSPQYQGEYPENVVTVRNAWLRPSAFNILDFDDAKELRKKYPNGCKVVFINDTFAEAVNESLDDSWTLTCNPLSDFIHHDPLGLLLVSIQEITNDLISLILQTVEHGIGQTFADPGVLDFNAYRQMESVPGGIYEATPKSGKSIGDAFHEVKTANLSPEVMPFADNIQSLAQLVSGALPSLFGGVMQGSETASQYSMSRAQALQRLQNTWKIFTSWWKDIFGKVIPMYIKEMKDDERDVQRDKDGNFINVFIRKAELEGRIGKVELEANENLPLTWSQQKDVIMQLLQAGNPEILAMLGSPENLPIIREAIGLNDFYVPGEDSRDKQYDEIKLLLNSEPLPNPMDPMNPEMPSVDVDPIFDNSDIEFEICRKWATSEAGRQAKTDNPNGYRNVLLHGKLHYMANMQQQMTEQQQGQAPPEKPAENTQTPIQGEQDVQTAQ
jgi:hypothetical protein